MKTVLEPASGRHARSRPLGIYLMAAGTVTLWGASFPLTKAALDGATLSAYEAAIDREIAGQTELLQSPQFQAALAAFANR